MTASSPQNGVPAKATAASPLQTRQRPHHRHGRVPPQRLRPYPAAAMAASTPRPWQCSGSTAAAAASSLRPRQHLLCGQGGVPAAATAAAPPRPRQCSHGRPWQHPRRDNDGVRATAAAASPRQPPPPQITTETTTASIQLATKASPPRPWPGSRVHAAGPGRVSAEAMASRSRPAAPSPLQPRLHPRDGQGSIPPQRRRAASASWTRQRPAQPRRRRRRPRSGRDSVPAAAMAAFPRQCGSLTASLSRPRLSHPGHGGVPTAATAASRAGAATASGRRP